MVMHTVCMLSMYHGYIWLCILAMYFGPACRPAGAFWAKYLISCESKVACAFSKNMSQGALNQVLTLPDYRTHQMLQIPLKIIDLQNDLNMLVAKQWKIIISGPMSCMRLFENLAVLEKWYLKGT